MRILSLLTLVISIALTVACSKDDKDSPNPYSGHWMESNQLDYSKRSGLYDKTQVGYVDASGNIYALVDTSKSALMTAATSEQPVYSNQWNYIYLKVSSSGQIIIDQAGIQARVNELLTGMPSYMVNHAKGELNKAMNELQKYMASISGEKIDADTIRVSIKGESEVIELKRVDGVTADLIKSASGASYKVAPVEATKLPEPAVELEESLVVNVPPKKEVKVESAPRSELEASLRKLPTGHAYKVKDGNEIVDCYYIVDSNDCDKIRRRIRNAMIDRNIRLDAFNIRLARFTLGLSMHNRLILSHDISDEDLGHVLDKAVEDKNAIRKLVPLMNQLQKLNSSNIDFQIVVPMTSALPILQKLVLEIQANPKHSLNGNRINELRIGDLLDSKLEVSVMGAFNIELNVNDKNLFIVESLADYVFSLKK